MSNSFYTHGSYPTPNSPGSSAQLRAELELITAGFNKLPTLAGNGYKVAMVNAGGTALIASSALQALVLTASTIDSTPIGATTRAAGNFTTLSATGAASLGSAVTIAGGTINNTPIGGTTASSGAFTTVSASSGFTGNLTGNVNGAVTGNVIGNLTGNVTGNITAGSGSSTFNDLTINGTLNMVSGSAGTITGLANPTGSSDAANKGYVDTQDALRLLLAGGTMSGAIAMGSSKITGLGTPSADADAATKAYVDGVAQGLDPKASVRAASIGNLTLSGTQTIDGVAVTAGNRVLVKNQSTAANNGVYVVDASAWSRSTDMDAYVEFPGAFFFVEEGTVNDNSGWVCTVAQGGTLGVTAVTFEQFSGAGQITAGAGLTKTGNTLDVVTASSARIVVGTDSIDLATTGVSANTYRSVSVDAYGRVTAGTNPTTIAAYGLTDAYTKTEIDTALALRLARSGGTMTGAIAMSANKITGLADPTLAQDAASKNYIDTLFGSTASAAASASAASDSEIAAGNSEIAAGSSATAAAGSATSAAASYDSFDDRYLGPKNANPTLDNDGNALLTGALYWNSVANEMRVYSGSAWLTAYLPATGYVQKAGDTMTGDLTAPTFLGNVTSPTTITEAGYAVVTQRDIGTEPNEVPLNQYLGSAAYVDAGTFVTPAGAQTLTNKTLVAPALGTPASGVLSSCTVDGTDGVGFRNIPQNSQSAAYTLVLADAGKHIYHPSTDANARTFTIPTNSSVAYPVGTALTFVNMTSEVVTIAINTDTMYLSSSGTTGSRSLAQYGSATALKITSTSWIISGSGLT